MKNQYFDIVVKKLSKYKNKLIEIKKIKEIIKNIIDTEYSEKKVYKMIYYLKNRGYLESLKKDIFFIKNPEKIYSEGELLENFYWDILKRHCNDFLTSKRYIGGLKALELNISSFDIPEEIMIVNVHKQATEKVTGNKQVLFKIYESNKKNLFPIFYKHTKKIYIKNICFYVANIELAILETLYNQSVINKGYSEELIKKILRKNKHLDTKIREECLKNNKHHSTINKIYKLSQTIDPELADIIKKMIKKYSYFI